MQNIARGNPLGHIRPPARVLALAIAASAVLLVAHRSARAQSCQAEIPQLDPNVCQGTGDSIGEIKDCYERLYDENVIPAFRYVAECSHQRAESALKAGLENAAAQVVGTIQQSIAAIDGILASPAGPAACVAQLNEIEALMAPILAAERGAGDLDAFRRAEYSFERMVSFTDLILAARQNRAACDDALERIRKHLVLLSQLKARHLDYCQVLRDSAEYESAARIQSLAQWTVVDPDIDFEFFFNAGITWNPQCAYFEFNDEQTEIRYTPCVQATVEYEQTLSDLDTFAIGWLADNRVMISAVSAATAGTIFALAGWGELAGPYGAAVGALVGAIISGIQYFIVQGQIEDLKQMIADKEAELAEVVEENYITEDEFHGALEELCSGWEPIVEGRVQDLLGGFDAARHVVAIDKYFQLSDKLHNWYNELFLWATEPGPDGRRFLDELAERDLLRQRNDFDQRIFRARTDQEIAAQKNRLINLKGQTTLLDCTDIPAREKRRVLAELRGGVNALNLACSSVMETLAVRTERAIPFAAGGATSDISCTYKGFRSDVASVVVGAGTGFTATMTIRNATGGVVAALANVTSETDWTQVALPGFACQSESGQPFGTSAGSRLAPGTYALRLAENIYGFGESEAGPLRPFVRDIDGGMRTKIVVCTRQLGTPLALPRTAESCGIPANF